MDIDKKHQTITDWSIEDRPREKLINNGVKSLSDSELIAILLRSGTKEETAVDLARKILKNCNNDINKLCKQNYFDLIKIKGVGKAKAISIIAAIELGKRRPQINEQRIITNSQFAFNAIYPYMQDLEHEEFYSIFLDKKKAIIEIFKTSQGGSNSTIVDNKIILKRALQNLADSIIIVHNHPSGNLTASQSDIKITESLKEACKILEIALIDHLIIGNNDYFSFAENNKL